MPSTLIALPWPARGSARPPRRGRNFPPPLSRNREQDSAHPPQRYRRMAEYTGGELLSNTAGVFCRVITEYPNGHPFGQCRLDTKNLAAEIPFSCFAVREGEGIVGAEGLLFFFIET